MKKILIILALLFAASSVSASSTPVGENMMPSGSGYVYADGWIYYHITDDHGKSSLNKIRNDGTNAQRILDVGGYFMSVSGDELYFINNEGICRVNTDGSGYALLSAAKKDTWGADGIVTTGDYVYVREGQRLYRFSVDPWVLVGEIKLPSRFNNQFLIADGWIYFSDSGYNDPKEGVKFYKIRTDFTQNSAWFQPPTKGDVDYWSIIDGKLYYCITQDGMAQLRRVNLDGTGDALVFESKVIVRWFDGEWVYGQRFVDEPEYTSVEDSWDDVEYYHYNIEEGFGRANILTGELERLGDTMPVEMVGDWFIDTSKLPGWGEGPPNMVKKDGSAEVSMAVPDYSEPIMEEPMVEVPSVSLSIKEGSLTPYGATVFVENHSDQQISSEHACWVMRKAGDAYEPLKRIVDGDFANLPDEAYVLNKNERHEEYVPWSTIYGKLEAGKYQIIKTVYYANTYLDLSVEFIIE